MSMQSLKKIGQKLPIKESGNDIFRQSRAITLVVYVHAKFEKKK